MLRYPQADLARPAKHSNLPRSTRTLTLPHAKHKVLEVWHAYLTEVPYALHEVR